MNSDNQLERYAEFEPEANEIMFGQKTLPDRPLTDKEVSERKRIILKLVDQKLKFELIELIQQKQTNASNVYGSTNPTIDSIDTVNNSIALPNYQNTQTVYPGFPVNPQQNWQHQFQNSLEPQFQNEWQRQQSLHPNRMNPNSSWSKPAFNFQFEKERWHLGKTKKQSFEFDSTRIHHTNSIRSSAVSSNSKYVNSNNNNILINISSDNKKETTSTDKPPNQRASSSLSHQQQQHFPIGDQQIPSSSNSLKMAQSTNLTAMDSSDSFQRQEIKQSSNLMDQSTTIDLTVETDSPPRETMNGKRRTFTSSENIQTKRPLIEEKSKDVKGNGEVIINRTNVGTKDVKTTSSRNMSVEWSMLNQLVTIMCRNELHHCEPFSPCELKLKNDILIQVSMKPEEFRLNREVLEKLDRLKLETFISECHIILGRVSRAAPEIKSVFSESRKKLIKLNSRVDVLNDVQKLDFLRSKITNIMNPFLKPGENNYELITQLMMNPYVLEENGIIKNRIAGKKQSVHDLMKHIKGVLDSFVEARSPETFFLPTYRYIDVPFVVNLHNKSGKMTKEYATELSGVLFDSIKCLKTDPKPKIRDIRFHDGSLLITCINLMSFDWLEKTISNHLGVKILPVKKLISKNQLKTVCLNFKYPQYFHFNNLMDEIKRNNPRLFTRRWELRPPPNKKFVDSTKCVVVGVDVESLIVLEQMNRSITMRGSLVACEISYDDNEENFELMNFVKKKKQRKNPKKQIVE